MANKAVFFDRDGTLNVDIHYLHRPEDLIWTSEAVEAVKLCNDRGYLTVVITNQSGVARGYYDEKAVLDLHDWMNGELAKHGAHLDAIYYCPHHKDGKIPEYTRECGCRKPSPYMVNRACEELDIDKNQSFFVGDTDGDMGCAENAGVKGVRYTGGSLLELVKKAMDEK